MGSIDIEGVCRKTSTCRNFETISSGFGRLFAILGPPFPKHSGGPGQMGRLTNIDVYTYDQLGFGFQLGQ